MGPTSSVYWVSAPKLITAGALASSFGFLDGPFDGLFARIFFSCLVGSWTTTTGDVSSSSS